MLTRHLTFMTRHHLKLIASVFFSSTLLCPLSIDAITFNLKNKAPPKIRIYVGKGGNVSEVAFSVTASQLGTGTVITGSPPVEITLEIQATAANPLTGFLTVNSLSHPLTIDSGSGNTIPFSEISWTASEGVIPSGVFNETLAQPVISFPSSQGIEDVHTFHYENTRAIEAGTYEGRVIYTWSAP